MEEIIKDNIILIVTCGYTFLVGIGIGAAVTDVINRWNPKRKEEDEGGGV